MNIITGSTVEFKPRIKNLRRKVILIHTTFKTKMKNVANITIFIAVTNILILMKFEET